MQREKRLTNGREFEAVCSQGKSWSNDLVVLRVLPNDLDASRYGFAAGKRVGGAVVRNRVKRKLREVIRLTPTKDGWDIVFIARQAAAEADYQALSEAAQELLSRAQLLANGGNAG